MVNFMGDVYFCMCFTFTFVVCVLLLQSLPCPELVKKCMCGVIGLFHTTTYVNTICYYVYIQVILLVNVIHL